jgi:hypothetical protein
MLNDAPTARKTKIRKPSRLGRIKRYASHCWSGRQRKGLRRNGETVLWDAKRVVMGVDGERENK